MLQSDPTPAELAEKTIDYAEAKEAYFMALRAEVPELMKIAMGKEASPLELDTLAAAFAVAGEDHKKMAEEETLVLLKQFSINSSLSLTRVRHKALPKSAGLQARHPQLAKR